MASTSDTTKRTVIPKWKEYKEFAESGELLDITSVRQRVVYFPIDDYVGRWKSNPSLATAGDLLSAAIMNGQTQNEEVVKASRYVIEREDYGYQALCNTARMILSNGEPKSEEKPHDALREKIARLDNEDVYTARIAFLRSLIKNNPYNALWYVELSRCYVNLGLVDKAFSQMRIATHLAPNSRYVSRSAARMFLHKGEVDMARDVLIHNQAFLHDPWLIASEIAVDTAHNKCTKYLKRGLTLIESGNYSPFELTELASAIGTKELESSFKKGKKLLNQSLVSPNENSWAQAEWLLDRDHSLGLDMAHDTPSLFKNFEGKAIAAFSSKRYDEALEQAINWISEMRFATRPIYFAADMAYLYQERYEDAIRLLQLGIKMNPKELDFKNNLAYAYALNNQIPEAERELNELAQLIPPDSSLAFCMIATNGLIEFRKGNQDAGRQLYQLAIDLASQKRMRYLADKARLNLIREELIVNPKADKSILSPLDKLNTGDNRETEAMKQRILHLSHD